MIRYLALSDFTYESFVAEYRKLGRGRGSQLLSGTFKNNNICSNLSALNIVKLITINDRYLHTVYKLISNRFQKNYIKSS